jgi:hypothetical protein
VRCIRVISPWHTEHRFENRWRTCCMILVTIRSFLSFKLPSWMPGACAAQHGKAGSRSHRTARVLSRGLPLWATGVGHIT